MFKNKFCKTSKKNIFPMSEMHPFQEQAPRPLQQQRRPSVVSGQRSAARPGLLPESLRDPGKYGASLSLGLVPDIGAPASWGIK